ncbi:MAG: DUF3179 domain-containing protein [Candidatus Obscuribacterales bacterium]|nr:DUF3179 domain-containing protein [Candidatus Obscuribacterales bacterium]
MNNSHWPTETPRPEAAGNERGALFIFFLLFFACVSFGVFYCLQIENLPPEETPTPVATPAEKEDAVILNDDFLDCRGQFEALSDPKIVQANSLKQVDDDEEVLGITIGDEHRAYPLRFINWHHIVNDRMNGKSFAITYCMICNTGVAYESEVGNERLQFDVFGLYRGVLAMYSLDKNGKMTIWTHLDGEAVAGSRKGERLNAISVLNTSFGEWKKMYPNTTVPDWHTGYEELYKASMRTGELRIPPFFFNTFKNHEDKRLALNEIVLGLRLKSMQRAYPYKTLARIGAVNELLDDLPVTVLYAANSKTAAAYDARLGNKILRFTSDKGGFRDNLTNSLWNIDGVCIDGELKGCKLQKLTFTQSRWYGWSALFRESSIFAVQDVPAR